jgi:hypothetical protein
VNLTEAELSAIARDCGAFHAAAVGMRGTMPAPAPERVAETVSRIDAPAVVETAQEALQETLQDMSIDGLAAQFFAALSAERRALLATLDDTAGEALPIGEDETGAVIHALESAALERNPQAFAEILERHLKISREQAQRIVEDRSGEAVLVAAKAISVPSDTLVRIVLFLNPAIGESVPHVFDLAGYYRQLSRNAALNVIASLRKSAPQRARRPAHQPMHYDDEAARGRRSAAARQGIAVPERREGVQPGFGKTNSGTV